MAALFGAFAAPNCGARSNLTTGAGAADDAGTNGEGSGGSTAGRGGAAGTSGATGTSGAAGTSGVAGTGGVGSGGCPSDLESNPKHCGRCNLDCEGGECSFGICKPVVIAQLGDQAATALALDENHVYWARPIMRIPKAGGAAELLSNETPDAIWGIAVDASHVFWGSPTYGPVRRVTKSGAITQALTPESLGANRIAVDSSGVYFTSRGVWRMAHDGSGLRELTPEGDTGIALDRNYVYFTSRIKGEVYRMTKDGTSLTVLATAPLANEVAVYDEHVVFTAQGDGLVRRVPRTGGPDVVIATGSDGVAVDVSGVYFTDVSIPSVGYVPIEGFPNGEMVSVALERGHPRAIATDETRVFWTTHAPSSAIYKLVKSGVLLDSRNQ